MKGSLAYQNNHQRENRFMVASSSLKGSLTVSCTFVVELQEYYSELLLSTWLNVLQSREAIHVQKLISNTITVSTLNSIVIYFSPVNDSHKTWQ